MNSAAQRGAILVMAAVAMSLAIGAALLAVDLGSLFHERRYLQTVADTAALSAVNDPSSAQAIALDAVAGNDYVLPGSKGRSLIAIPGYYDTSAREFFPGGASALWNAVQVTVSEQQPYFFALGSREMSATATAVRQDIAGISVSASVATVNTEMSVLLNAILGGLLNTSLNLSAIAYEGLLGTAVSLLDLVKAHASIGTVEGLLDADLSVRELLDLSAQALQQKSLLGLDATVVDTLNVLALQVDPALRLKLGDLIDLGLVSGHQAAGVDLNLLQLLTLSAQVANGDHFLNLPIVGVSLPGLVDLNLALTMLEKPSIAVGPAGLDASGAWRTTAHNAQWRVKLDLLVGEVLGGLLRLPIYLEVGAGEAWVEAIDCRWPREDSEVTVGAASSAARLYVGDVNPDAMTNRAASASVTPATILNVLGLLQVRASAVVDVPSGGDTLVFTGPFNAENTQRVSGLSTTGLFAQLLSNLDLDVVLLGLTLPLGDVLSAILSVLAPVFSLLDAILNPVLSLLGIQLSVADVSTFDLSCGAPYLVR